MYKRELIVNKENHQLRIDDFAYQHHISRKALKVIKQCGDILVNGEHQTVRYVLNEGDYVVFIYPPEDNQIIPENVPLYIVYEDDFLLIVDKPKGMACFPTRSHPCQTLANALSYYYHSIELDSTVHFVNRLDKDTAGLMMIAKYREIHDMMCQNIQHIYRRYQAHVEGQVEQGVIDLPIHKDGQNMRRIIDENGKDSRTYYRCLEYSDGISRVECILETGRTHQIRVHMAAIGHPLIGDLLYGGKPGTFDLESIMIAFVHPITKQIKVIKKMRLSCK